MNFKHHTREHSSFTTWFSECSTWFDMTWGDEVEDHPGLPWRQWYDEGLTVEQAVQRAIKQAYG